MLKNLFVALSVAAIALMGNFATTPARADIACGRGGCWDTGQKIKLTGGCTTRPDGSVVCKRRSPGQLRNEWGKWAPIH
jgi:hypothetical protein